LCKNTVRRFFGVCLCCLSAFFKRFGRRSSSVHPEV
jgi:hypothetical protein